MSSQNQNPSFGIGAGCLNPLLISRIINKIIMELKYTVLYIYIFYTNATVSFTLWHFSFSRQNFIMNLVWNATANIFTLFNLIIFHSVTTLRSCFWINLWGYIIFKMQAPTWAYDRYDLQRLRSIIHNHNNTLQNVLYLHNAY